MALRRLLSERFWTKVDIRGLDECWEWKGAKGSDGYGTIGEGGRGGCILGAHRVAFFLEYRYWPNLHVLHRCDNPACVRVSHLLLGTHADNMAARAKKGRGADGSGEANLAAKLTEGQVVEMRRLHALGLTQRALSEKFGTSRSNVTRIIHRKTWGSI